MKINRNVMLLGVAFMGKGLMPAAANVFATVAEDARTAADQQAATIAALPPVAPDQEAALDAWLDSHRALLQSGTERNLNFDDVLRGPLKQLFMKFIRANGDFPQGVKGFITKFSHQCVPAFFSEGDATGSPLGDLMRAYRSVIIGFRGAHPAFDYAAPLTQELVVEFMAFFGEAFPELFRGGIHSEDGHGDVSYRSLFAECIPVGKSFNDMVNGRFLSLFLKFTLPMVFGRELAAVEENLINDFTVYPIFILWYKTEINPAYVILSFD